MMLINSYIGRLYNETAKAYELGEFKTAAMISLEIAFLKGRVGTANFVFLGHRYLKDINVAAYYASLESTILSDHILKDLRSRKLVSFNDTTSFLEYAYPNWKIVDPKRRILNPKDIITNDKIFERSIIILENDLITQFEMGVISLHKMVRLYNEGFENELSITLFEEVYQQTLKMLENPTSELITDNSNLYKAEAHFLKAKAVHFHETRLFNLNKVRALEYYQSALLIKSPRKFIYMLFYVYLKTELLLDDFLNYTYDFRSRLYLIIIAAILATLRVAKTRVSKHLIKHATQYS